MCQTLALAPGGFLCSAGCPAPTDSLRLPSGSICHSDASPGRGFREQTLVFAFSTSRFFGSLKSEKLEAQTVDLCWSLGMHLKAPPAYTV